MLISASSSPFSLDISITTSKRRTKTVVPLELVLCAYPHYRCAHVCGHVGVKIIQAVEVDESLSGSFFELSRSASSGSIVEAEGSVA